jgi:hypothetical protein
MRGGVSRLPGLPDNSKKREAPTLALKIWPVIGGLTFSAKGSRR